MTPPLPPKQLPDADLWEYYRARGLSAEEATLHVNRRRGTQTGTPPANQPFPTKGKAALVGAVQGQTSGFGDELLGLLRALGPQTARANPLLGTLTGGEPQPPITKESIAEHIGQVREEFSAARAAHPIVAGVGNVGGALLNPLSRVLPAPTNAVRGAVTGSALGAAQGLGEGGGSVTERLPAAGAGAVVGGATGAALGPTVGKLVAKVMPIAQRAWSGILRRFRGKGLPIEQVHTAADAAVETAVRESLQRRNVPPQVVEQVVQALRARRQLSTPPPMPPSSRPGETITPSLERATFLRRGGTVRQDVSPISGNRIMSFTPPLPDVGRGATLPYYPRGGRVEQAFGTPPMTSPSVPSAAGAEGQMAAIQQYLRSLTPAQLPDAIAGAQALGIPLGGTPEQVLALLLGGR